MIVNAIQSVTETAHSISDFGALIVNGAAFIVLSIGMWFAIFKWFKGLINNILADNKKTFQSLLNKTDEQNTMIRSISEGLRVETQLRIRNLSGFAFDLSVEQVCRLIKSIREENHIDDREKTAKKIRTMLHNIHEDRKSRFDPFTYRGKHISEYCNPEWIEQVAVVVESEIYNEHGPDNKRARTNVKMAYDDIKLDFYHRMNS